MTRGIKAKVEGSKPAKVAKKTTKRQNSKEATKEKTNPYEYIRREGEDIYLVEDVVKRFDELELEDKDVNNELMLFQLKRENYDKELENMKLKIQLIERDKRDVETAIFHKKTEKKNCATRRSEYRSKICKELGEGITGFGYHPDTLLVEIGNS